MSLYGNFTLKEWLALHCVTKDIDSFFRKALEDHDEPMMVLALAELTKRGDTDLVSYAIFDAVEAGYITNDHFSVVLLNALSHYCMRDPILKGMAKYVRANKAWPKTTAEIFKDTKFPDYVSAESFFKK